jgi:hypothetical protein
MPTSPASPEADPAVKLRERVVAALALALLRGAAIEPHPAACTASRRRANQLNYALMGARRELERLAVLLE